jgi:hypothetical protein
MSRTTRTTLAVLLGVGLVAGGVWVAVRNTGRGNSSTAFDTDRTPAATTAARPGAIDTSFGRDSIDREAVAALERMGAYLRTLKAFQVQGTITREDVLPNGQKVQRSGAADIIVRRPDRLRAELTNDQRHRFLFYDGKSFTLWADVPNYYATADAPPTIAELLDQLQTEFGIEVPLEDLFHWGTERADVAALTGALHIGPSSVDGVTTDHYAFRQSGLDWQIWIQAGEYPLPRKLVLTTLTDEARPQHTSILAWNLTPSFNEAAFTFTPSRGAQRIRLAAIRAGSR